MFRRRKRDPSLATPSESTSRSASDAGAFASKPPTEPAAETHGRRFSDSFRTVATSIDDTVVIQGSFSGNGNIAIRGHVEGDVDVKGLLLLVAGAKIHGDVSATDAIIEGELEGSLSVKEKLELRTGCRVVGDIRAASMAMADGCRYEGNVAIGADEGENTQTQDRTGSPISFREKRAELAAVASGSSA